MEEIVGPRRAGAPARKSAQDQELVPGRRELDLARGAPQELDAQLAFEAAAISLAAPACTP
jgi:hypothetical protein